jgi:hypothetical protein
MSARYQEFAARTGARYVGRVCPVTRRSLQPGEEIAVCSSCGNAYTTEGWRYIGSVCSFCGSRDAELMVAGALAPTEVPATVLSPSAWLHRVDRHDRRQYRLKEAGETRIGRDPDNDIVLGSEFVSGRHALVREDRGIFTVHDLASTNGTWLNGHRIHRSILYDGDVLTIGQGITLVFKQIRDEHSPGGF